MSNSANVYCAFGEGRKSGICPSTWIFGKLSTPKKRKFTEYYYYYYYYSAADNNNNTINNTLFTQKVTTSVV
jgi:hypothetical protein